MNVLLLHGEARYFAGAERMLGYYLAALPDEPRPLVAVPPDTRLAALVPAGMPTLALESNTAFSLAGLVRNLARLRRAHRQRPVDVIHAWHARDWELAGLAARLLRRPAVGTLHDDPQAAFIRPRRQRLMRGLARHALARVICVSGAVADRCRQAGYPEEKLVVIHNGLLPGVPEPFPPGGEFRIGFLGAFSARKGLDRFCEMLGEFSRGAAGPWRAVIAGAAQDEAGRALADRIQARFAGEPWWPRLEWIGWVADARELLRNIHVLVVPSVEFDPFPTVLLEAAAAGRPVVAARVGGAPEIVRDEVTGWLYPPQRPEEGARRLRQLAADASCVARMGAAAAAHLAAELGMDKMVVDHRRLYLSLAGPC
ncbi:MAG TPA: glycosyltransferase family 4 protein [Verrucomicrobiota bacterium]|nr:glycosyltransferase family 4 protein [Verrucomicrobiota bacterium]